MRRPVPELELAAAAPLEEFPASRDFPQLRVASDPGRMLEVFRRDLKPAAPRQCRIDQCVPFRFRCGPSKARCVMQYTLRIVEAETGRRWHQWVTGVLYAEPGAAERRWRELGADDPRHEIPEGWLPFEPLAFVPDLQMVVQVFPFDPRLRTLRRVMAGALPGLEPLVLRRLPPGEWDVEGRTIEPTRYRTELGAALRYTLQARDRRTASSMTVRCYVKVYRDDHGAETFELLQSLSDRDPTRARSYAVVRPVTYLSELRTLVLEEAPGSSLQQVLLGSHDPVEAVRVVARAAAAFNRDDVAVVRHHSLADQLTEVQGASSLIQWACPGERADVRAITAAVVEGLREVPPAPMHRDLKTDHIFLSGDRVTFIDLDSAALGDPARDPAHLFAHIAGRVGLDGMPGARARAAAVAFLEEYFRHVPESWRQQLPLQCAGALLEVARGTFKRQECAWPSKVATLVAEARRVLDSGGF